MSEDNKKKKKIVNDKVRLDTFLKGEYARKVSGGFDAWMKTKKKSEINDRKTIPDWKKLVDEFLKSPA